MFKSFSYAFGAFMVFVSVFRLLTGNALFGAFSDDYWPRDDS